MKYWIIAIILLFAALGLGYWKKGQINDSKKNVVESVDIPECFAGLCPEYLSMNVDGDSQSESVVVIPTAMTQGAGKVWIIKDGKVVFDSGEKMRINIYQTDKQIEKGNGFVLQYGIEINSTNGEEKVFSYEGGRFVAEEN